RATYACLAKTMREESLKQVAAVIAGKRINLKIEEARELAKRALKFKQERGRLPSITSPDAWEKRMAEGVAFLARMRAEAGVAKFTEEDDALLEELGVEAEETKDASRTPREERIIAGFEEIQRFVEQHGRAPQHGEDRDIFE